MNGPVGSALPPQGDLRRRNAPWHSGGSRLQVTRLHRSGAAPSRILLIGDRTDLWPSTTDPRLALPATLADELAAAPGDGVDLDVLTDLSPVLQAVRGAFGRWRLWRYDAVVIVLGARTAPQSIRNLTRLLREVERDAASSARIVVASAATAVPRGTWSPGDARVTSMRLPPADPDQALPIVATLRGGIDRLRTPVERSADEIAAMAERRRDAERERVRALEELRLAESRPTPRLNQVVEMARVAFEVEHAELNLLDRDAQITLAAMSTAGTRKAKSDSFCHESIRLPGPTVVLDSRLDPRFSVMRDAWGTDSIRFYAAYPVESPTGYRVGTLCIWDRYPRVGAEVDITMLRDLALLAEAELIDPR